MDTFDYVQVRKDQLIWLIAILIAVFVLFWAAVCLLAILFNRVRLLGIAREKEGRLAESERTTRHISDALHDDFQNQLAYVGKMLGDFINIHRRDGIHSLSLVINAREVTLETIEKSRNVGILLDGKRIIGMGLRYAITLEAERLSDNGLNIRCHTEDGVAEQLDEDAALKLFRIVQEVLANAVKHADASEITVLLRKHRRFALEIVIHDDGVGFDPSLARDPLSRGLDIIRLRAEDVGALLTIDSAPGAGTAIHINLPQERLPTNDFSKGMRQ